MIQVVFPKTCATREIHKRVPAVTGKGFTSVYEGEEEFFFETAIDLAALRDIARKAARNKSGKAKQGPLHLRILSRRRIAQSGQDAMEAGKQAYRDITKPKEKD